MEYNSLNPYSIHEEGEWDYSFLTKGGVRYRAYFIAVPYLHPLFADTYSFNIEPMEGDVETTHQPLDVRIGATIARILAEFFRKNSNSMIMVCDNTDGRERKRRALFDRWYDSYSGQSLIKLDAALQQDGYRLLVSMYIAKTNPKKRELIDAFNEIVKTDLYELGF